VKGSAPEDKRASVRALHKLLTEIAVSEHEELFDFVPSDALQSQSGLANFNLVSRGIRGVSLNTCKRIAGDCLENGFQQLDDARKLALETLEARRKTSGRPGRRTKKAVLEHLADAERRVRILREDLNHISGALRFAVMKLSAYAHASHNPELLERLRADMDEIRVRAAQVRNAPKLAASQ
jgi:hypothetical protein